MRLMSLALLTAAFSAPAAAQSSPPVVLPGGKVRPAVPIGNPSTWFTLGDYPPEARKNHVSGVVAFRLTIGLGGEVTGCEITASSGSAALDQGTCDVRRRKGTFRPALGSAGQPVPGSWRNRVRWVAPHEGPPTKLESLTTGQTFVVETDGSASGCRATRGGIEVTEAIIPTPCATGEKSAPFTGISGKPARKKITVTRTVSVSDPER